MSQDYTLYDWLQILLLLVGMPVIAASGAALGLIGRIRRGGFLPATIAGLSGAAIASAVLYLGIWTLRLESLINPRVFLEIYDSGYQRYISIACLIATFAIAFLWAIRWRVHRASIDPTPLSINLRSALFIQVLSLLCVGSWCGLRLLIADTADPRINTKRVWENRGWEYHDGGSLGFIGDELSPREVAYALSPSQLTEMAHYPTVRALGFSLCDLSTVDLSPLKSNVQITSIGFASCDIDKTLRRDLPQLTQLAAINLSNLKTSGSSLIHLGELPKLKTLHAQNIQVERNDLRGFLATSKLESIYLTGIEAYGPGPAIEQWPSSTRFLQIFGGNLTSEDLRSIGKLKSLTHLHTLYVELDDSILEHLQDLKGLQSFMLDNKGITDRGYEIISTRIQPPLLWLQGGELSPKAVEQISAIPKLHRLLLSGVIIGDDDLVRIANSPSLEKLHVSSPNVTMQGLMSLSATPKLRELHYPSFGESVVFESHFANERIRLGLPTVQMMRGPTIQANGSAVIIKPNASRSNQEKPTQ